KVFERAKSTFNFVLLAGLISTTVSATFGVTSLTLGGFAQADRLAAIWLTWWLGDIVGCLLIAPLLIISLTQPYPELKPRRILEAAGLLLTILSVGYIVFLTGTREGVEYVALLPLLWAAFRFGQRGAVTAAFFTAAIALFGTLDGIGPFVSGDPNESLFQLQGFTGTLALAALVLASVITERTRAEERIEVQDAVSRILADSTDLNEAGSKILHVLCERARWDTACVWNVDRSADEMVCLDFFHRPSLKVPQFEAISRQQTFARGVGLPGRVWSSGSPSWIPDVRKESNSPGATIAANEGLRAGFAFPIKFGRDIVGAIECFSREVREVDDDLLHTMGDIGAQVGRFIERKWAEEALFEREKELADFFDTSPLSLHWVGNDGTILRANEAELNMLGYSAHEYIGRNIVDFHVDSKAIGTILSCLARGEILREYPAQLRCKNGSISDVIIDSSVYWKNGEFVHTRCFTRDITERKRAEELLAHAKNELVQANEELERRVQERTADLQQANATLLKNIEEQRKLEEQLRQAQKMESIGTLAGGIAHDFNNTLNIIRGYAMLASAESSDSREIAESMKIINEEVDRGASVVRQLLTLARKTETRLARADANQIVMRVSELIKQTFPKTIKVRLELDRTLPSMLADPNHINQALLNICVNARDAMPDGGELTLTTATINQELVQSRHPEATVKPYVCIAVTDTGMGMVESIRSRIFEPFFTTKGIDAGTGLGLAMVYGIVTSHHGFIDVESDAGQGTMFRLCLPVFQAENDLALDEMTDAKAPAHNMIHKGATVLLAEDEQGMARLLENSLQHEGYHVLAAKDGAEAIDVYERHRNEIDVVVTDLGLPKISGSEVIREMKKQNPEVKIIVTTGYLEPESKSELLAAEVKEYIYKPYSVDEILAKLQSLLDTPEAR
ncbi:MAG TPA: MASE1 domain-containing protein, partial [Candidatus Polarisedimenticolaceae bacterium]|nr:MASE1 domain-containing protein [Candidatus Polarisedimenticolaceae bacterium]